MSADRLRRWLMAPLVFAGALIAITVLAWPYALTIAWPGGRVERGAEWFANGFGGVLEAIESRLSRSRLARTPRWPPGRK